MEQSFVHEGVTLEALGDSAKAIKPCKEPFHHPTVAGKFLVGVWTVFEVSSVRGATQRNAVADTALNQTEAKRLTIVASVRRQATGARAGTASSARNPYLSQGQRRGGDIGHVACAQMHG